MSKAENVVEFYVLCNKLKNVVRSGWKVWNVKRERLESVAEHIYGVQMLAIAMWSEYGYGVDIRKVIMMMAVHELEEIKIGDLIPFEISKEKKAEIGHKAVDEILAGLAKKEEIKELVLEFDLQETAEAKFAFYCDKLEADLQCEMYDEEGCIDLADQVGNPLMKNETIKRHLSETGSVGKAWTHFNQEKYGYDRCFAEVAKYAEERGMIKE